MCLAPEGLLAGAGAGAGLRLGDEVSQVIPGHSLTNMSDLAGSASDCRIKHYLYFFFSKRQRQNWVKKAIIYFVSWDISFL